MSIDIPNKRPNLFVALILILLIVFTLLIFLFNFYPGGYSFKESNDGVLIEKGIFKKEAFNFTSTNKNELTLALLKNNINHLKTLWYVSLIFLANILISAITFIRLKSKVPFVVLSVVFIALAIMVFSSYVKDIDYINSLISKLTRTS